MWCRVESPLFLNHEAGKSKTAAGTVLDILLAEPALWMKEHTELTNFGYQKQPSSRF